MLGEMLSKVLTNDIRPEQRSGRWRYTTPHSRRPGDLPRAADRDGTLHNISQCRLAGCTEPRERPVPLRLRFRHGPIFWRLVSSATTVTGDELTSRSRSWHAVLDTWQGALPRRRPLAQESARRAGEACKVFPGEYESKHSLPHQAQELRTNKGIALSSRSRGSPVFTSDWR